MKKKIKILSSNARVVHVKIQNRPFPVVDRTREVRNVKKTTARAKRAKELFFVVKYANFQVLHDVVKLPMYLSYFF